MICATMWHEDWRDIVWSWIENFFVVSRRDESANFCAKHRKNMDQDRPIYRPGSVRIGW